VTVLQHLTSPWRAIQEMARVTRPGGRVAALEFDLGTSMIDHPDHATTRLILASSEDDAVQSWMGRQLPRLFRQAGLTDVSLTRP
jgi:ubiquinone/menaquinone biosynthesis C-methylase UbiE